MPKGFIPLTNIVFGFKEGYFLCPISHYSCGVNIGISVL